jgi:starch-binding outer membrane protein, SusD/RagB family
MKTAYRKSIYVFLLFIALAFLVESCKKDWLEPKPLSIFTPENAFVDSRGMYGALTACEKAMREEFYGGIARLNWEMCFSEVSVIGITDRPGPPQNMNIQVNPISSQNSDNTTMEWYWNQAFKIIKYANVVISRINNTTFASEAERNAVLGSAYFHRAYQYYRLVHQFGDVPFIGREIQEPKLDFYSTQREVILRKIKKDMEFASTWCSDNVDRGRITKGACAHLLTKINLALGEFDAAITSASAVINGGTYSLMKTAFGSIPKEDGNYLTNLGVVRDDVISRLHWWANKAISANKEVLLLAMSVEDLVSSRLDLKCMYNAVPFWSCANSNMLYTPDGKGPGTSATPGEAIKLVETFGRGVGTTRATSYATKRVWDDPNDLRHKKYNWMEMEDLVYNSSKSKEGAYYGKPLQFRDGTGKVLTTDTIRNWFGWPHYKLYNPEPRVTQPGGGSYDWYIFRLAETYLLRAEAYWWKGDLVNAMADVNAVRTRAGCAPYTNTATFDIGTILDERVRELYYEEPRKTELTRISYIFAKTGKSYQSNSYTTANFGTKNFFFDRITEKNDFYNKNVKAVNGQEFTMSAYHVLWPIPQTSINSNPKGVINQNFGYDGYANNVPALSTIPAEDDN